MSAAAKAGRYGWHGADCGNVGAVRIGLEHGGKRVQVMVCCSCGKVIVARVLFGEPRPGILEATAIWAAQLLGTDVRDLVVGESAA